MKTRLLCLLACAVSNGHAQSRPRPSVDWPAHGNDAGGLKYSPLTDVNRANVAALTPLYSWEAHEQPIAEIPGAPPARPGLFQATPLAIHDTLYVSTPFNRVIALDAVNGRELWAFDPQPWKTGQPSNGTGFVHRGVATWTNGRERRVFMNSRWRLFALDAATGTRIAGFGANGEVDVTKDLSRPVNKLHYTNTSPPVVWGDVVILGNGVGDRLIYKGDPPGDIQAFDVRTGRRVWRFQTVPEAGQPGNDTWKDDSWKWTGHTNAWAPFTVDSARGLVYVPVGTPSNDWYGGGRKGANLFGETILCLDARTGKRVWHFQIAHHGLWDYDPPSPPNVVTITHEGQRVDVVVAPTKQGYLFVFDRLTGKPLWPVNERPVAQSDVPGEESWPTQPAPTKPAPFEKQGFTLDDIIDYTPELKAAALARLKGLRYGPLYTPPSLEGTVTAPGSIGGANWGGASVDPETGWLYVKSTNQPSLWRIQKREVPSDTIDAAYAADLPGSGLSIRVAGSSVALPINKGPYGTLTAIDLNTGDHKWKVVIGDTPEIRNHPALAGAKLPDKLGVAGSAGTLVTKGGLVFSSGGGRVLYAFDARTGKTLWEHDLGQVAYASPMTFRSHGRQIIVIATGGGTTSKLVAFALPAAER